MGEHVGDTVPSFGTTIQTMNKYIYEIHHCLWMDPGSHNNQPKIGVHNTGKYDIEGSFDELEARGIYDTIVVAKIEQQRKKKYTMALKCRRPINFHTTTNQK